MDSASAEDLTCPVCKENFKDPFVLTCKHKYCTECLRSFWEDKEKRCPLCRRKSSQELPPVMCILHSKKVQHFCEEDKQLMCEECVTSEKHTNHTIKPIGEVVSSRKEKLKTEKKSLEEKRKHKENIKGEFEESAKHIKVKAEHTHKLIEDQFETLRQKLEEEKQAAIAALREEEEKMTKKTVEEIESQISTITDAIKDTEEMLKASDDCLLKEADVLLKRVQISQPDPELPSAASINVSRYLWNLMSNIKKKMEETINNFFQDTPVLLDPTTAHPHLVVSDDQTSVKRRENLPEITEKPYHPYVLGLKGYNSGKHSWDVEVKDSKFWTVGVTTESNHKKGGDVFKSDNWSVHYDNYGMTTWAGFSVHQNLERVRVELDYDNGTVSFSDSVKNTQLHTFTTTFTETVFPFFHTLDSLKILRLSDE